MIAVWNSGWDVHCCLLMLHQALCVINVGHRLGIKASYRKGADVVDISGTKYGLLSIR